jgi:hypothetical protein
MLSVHTSIQFVYNPYTPQLVSRISLHSANYPQTHYLMDQNRNNLTHKNIFDNFKGTKISKTPKHVYS